MFTKLTLLVLIAYSSNEIDHSRLQSWAGDKKTIGVQFLILKWCDGFGGVKKTPLLLHTAAGDIMHQRDYFDLMWFPDQEENSIILFPMYFELEFILTTLKSLSLESDQKHRIHTGTGTNRDYVRILTHL